MGEPSSGATKAGRGLLAIAGAKVYFILTSYAVQLLLPRIFGEPKEFGLYSAAMSGVSIVNNVLIVATIQTVSKFVSEDEKRSAQTLRQALMIQTGLGAVLAGSLFASAPWLAAFLLDDQLTVLLRIASAVVISYALYAALVGSLNGRQLFAKQAGLDALFSTLRTVGILGGAAFGFGAVGAIGGFASAAVMILITAAVWIGLGDSGQKLPLKRWASFAGPIWLYQICLNGILLIDLQVLKLTAAELAQAAGSTALEAADIANEYVGFYRAAQTFAFVPYQLIVAVTFIIFPMISKASSEGLETQNTIRNAMRVSLLLLLAVAAPISGAAEGVLRLAYPDAYLAGAGALSILSFGVTGFALFVVNATVLSGAGKPSIAATIAASALVIVIVANRALVQYVGLGADTLLAAAIGTSIGMAVAGLLAAAMVYYRFGAFASPITVARALVAGGVGFMVARVMPTASWLDSLAALVCGGLSYLAALWLTRELHADDLRAVRSVLRGGDK